jgi:HEAT repeat protein
VETAAKAAPGLREALVEADFQGRREAALALVDRAEGGLDAETRRLLTRRITEDPDADVRQFAVEALGVAGVDATADEGQESGTDGTPASTTAAIRSALDDPDEWVRAEAIVAHSRVAPDATAPLEEHLTDDSPWVRRNALIALAKTGQVSRSTLEARLRNDRHPAVREYSAAYLGDLAADSEAAEEATRILAAVLARDPNAFVRAKAATGLGDLGTDRAEDALEAQGLGDRSEDVRRAAKRALATVRGTDPDRIDVPDRPDDRRRR